MSLFPSAGFVRGGRVGDEGLARTCDGNDVCLGCVPKSFGTPKPTGTFSATPVVNAAGTVSGSGVRLSAGSPSGSSATAGGVAAIGSALPAGAPSPKVTGIKVANGYVYVTVKGTVPYVAYGLTESATPGGEGTQAAVQSGAPTEDEEITFVAPAKSGGGFLKVGRK